MLHDCSVMCATRGACMERSMQVYKYIYELDACSIYAHIYIYTYICINMYVCSCNLVAVLFNSK